MTAQPDNGFVSQRLEETVRELEAVRGTLKQKTDQLAQAEDGLRFYADVRNYEPTRKLDGRVYQDRLKNDMSTADNNAETLLAGRRAREYFKKYE